MKLFAAALLVAAGTGCSSAVRSAASPAATSVSSDTNESAVVVFVAGREGLPGRVAIANPESPTEEARDVAFLGKDSFVEVGAHERVYLRMSFQKGHYVFERVNGAEAQPVLAKLASAPTRAL
jgi:hypothetical protein